MKRSEHIKLIKNSFKEAKKTSIKLKVVVISNDCCLECLKIDGQEIEFLEAEKNPPIPHPNCTREWGCNCTIGFLPIRDENGNLLIK
ncbi:MAG TPA: hypothetical protein PKC39_15175 [Ferruginibacter sp.]|nr:hypothetical protein [Ferruginibacter sp.]HMP22300.1 hypothetical protein [Ferruginibacter sp.]